MKTEDQFSNAYSIIGLILSVLTLFLPFLIYEYFFEHYYWHNRIFLYKQLKKKSIYVLSSSNIDYLSENIFQFNMSNNSTIWIYIDENKITWSRMNDEYIGLFTYSFIMKWYNNRIIKILKSQIY